VINKIVTFIIIKKKKKKNQGRIHILSVEHTTSFNGLINLVWHDINILKVIHMHRENNP